MIPINIHEDDQAPLDMYSTTVSLGDAVLSTTMDVSFFSHHHKWNPVLHEHSYHELFFLAEGGCSLRVGDGVHDFMKNDVIWVSQSAAHYVSHVDATTRLYSMGLMFTRGEKRANTRNVYQSLMGISRNADSFIVFSGATEIIDLIQKIRVEMSQKRFGFVEQGNAYLCLLYMAILRRWQGIPASDTNDVSLRDLDVDPSTLSPENRRQYDEMVVNVWFFRHYLERFTIDDVARSLHISVSQTNRFIRQLYGMGFTQKLTQVRMSVAQNLLLKTRLPAEQISRSVGYSSYAGFFAAFKKYTGLSPVDFRSQVRPEPRG